MRHITHILLVSLVTACPHPGRPRDDGFVSASGVHLPAPGTSTGSSDEGTTASFVPTTSMGTTGTSTGTLDGEPPKFDLGEAPVWETYSTGEGSSSTSSSTSDSSSSTSDSTTDQPPPAICGDGMAEGNEWCDGADMNGTTCKTLGYDGGSVSCLDSCLPDDTKCYVCGDGLCEPGEDSCSCKSDCPDDPKTCSPCQCGGEGGPGCFCDPTCMQFNDCCPELGPCGGLHFTVVLPYCAPAPEFRSR